MAEKRMFSKLIIDSDEFLDMPQSTQLLYFHLAMRADDDGFVNTTKSIMKIIGCREDDLKILIAKNFIITFQTGVLVITHWKIHNYIQKDRYNKTKYYTEYSQLLLRENKEYALCTSTLYTECIQPVHTLDTQIRIDKNNNTLINKKAINKSCAFSKNETAPHSQKQCKKDQKNDAEILFDTLWKLYPNKKGKAKVTQEDKKNLMLHSAEELIRSIERYTAELQKDAWKEAQNGNTFFKTGYIDYLDDNYVPSTDKQSKNAFNSFPQRRYNPGEIEQKLLSRG